VAASFSERLVHSYQITSLYFPEDRYPNNHRLENLQSHMGVQHHKLITESNPEQYIPHDTTEIRLNINVILPHLGVLQSSKWIFLVFSSKTPYITLRCLYLCEIFMLWPTSSPEKYATIGVGQLVE
jgi:hypothetical protein